jgi:polyvinyl alcohol dehydrogenase (cytochrome)
MKHMMLHRSHRYQKGAAFSPPQSEGDGRKRRNVMYMKRFLITTICIVSLLWLGTGHASAADWPMFLHDLSHSGNQNGEPTLTTGNVSSLTKRWSYHTGGVIAAQPIIVGATVYVGSWDGFMYALNRDTGALLWQTYLGKTTNPNTSCTPQTAGISAAPEIYNNVLYVPGGDQYFYALDPTHGNILWKTQIYTSHVPGDYYNWASTIIANVNGTPYAYIGLSSLCDTPLIPGALLKINLTTHAIDAIFQVVPPNGAGGGGIWTTPALDTSVNPPVMYVTTGTPNPGQPYSKAILALRADTMQLLNSWQVPDSDTNGYDDPDFGTSPTLFTTTTGHKMLVAAHKIGKLYALDVSNLAAGPVWSDVTSIGGGCPQCGQGILSTPIFDNTHNRLYSGGGKDPHDGNSQGQMRSIDPATGVIQWTHEDYNGTILASMAYTNGVIIYGNTSSQNTLIALDAATGNQLFSYSLSGGMYAAPSISNGTVFAGDVSGNITAFSLPNAARHLRHHSTPSGTTHKAIEYRHRPI